MGLNFYDQFSLLHASVGVLFFFWGISFKTAFILHIIFEFLENT